MRLKLTQAALAANAKTAREYINELERGRKTPGAAILAKLAGALRVKEDYFFVNSVR